MHINKNTGEFGQTVISSILLIMGIILLLLVFTPLYNYYLNPSFKILSFITALLLITSGIISVIYRFSYIPITTVVMYLLAISAVTYSVMGTMAVAAVTDAAPPPPPAASSENPGTEPPATAEEKGTTSAKKVHIPFEDGYMPISIPELYLMTGDNAPDYMFEGLTFRGRIVYLDSHDPAQGGYFLTRPSMSCCVADALQVFIPVRMPEEFEKEEFSHLQWIAVAGRLHKETTDIEEKEFDKLLSDTITAFNAIEQEYIFEVEKVTTAEAPRRPYITVFSVRPPFDY